MMTHVTLHMESFKVILIFAILGLGGTVAQKPIHDCDQIERFVAFYTHFLKQLPLTTSPVSSFCTNNLTVLNYKQAVEWFHNAQTNKTCEKNLNQNRLNVFQALYDQMTSIWDNANCEDCVSNQNDTAKFFEYYDEMQICTQIINPCDVCAGNYSKMQAYYEGLTKARQQQHICFDMEDRMNQTRYAWSAIYNCCKGKQHSQTAFIWFASGISSLPVIFYVMMYVITCRKEARERAAAPLLNDQSVAADRDGPQASTSTEQQQQLDDDEEDEDDQYNVDAEPKLNNLGNASGVRESKLIDLSNGSNENLNSDRDLKFIPIPTKDDEEDDVSMLNGPKPNNLLD